MAKTMLKTLASAISIALLVSACDSATKDTTAEAPQPEATQSETAAPAEAAPAEAKDQKITVTPETYIRAEVEGRFATIQQRAGGVNKFYLLKKPTPTDEQPVVRMNRDTLYGGAVIDTEGGAWVNVPEMPDDRYFSLFLIDQDHYVVDVITTSGRHKVPEGTTKYVMAVPRIQLMNYTDEDIQTVGNLLDQFSVEATSNDPFIPQNWDFASGLKLRAQYEQEFRKFGQYPSDWMDVRGKANDETRHLAVAGAWGLFPDKESVYINYAGPRDPNKCYVATYTVPENHAFWSITVYGEDAFMKSDNVSVGDRTAKFNDDGTFTVYYGSEANCGAKPNRLDITEGWNFLMRVYRPGEWVLNKEYKLPEVTEYTKS